MKTQPESRRSSQQHDVHYKILAWVRDYERAGNSESGVAEDIESNLSIRFAAPGTLVYELSTARNTSAHAVLRKALCALDLTKPAASE